MKYLLCLILTLSLWLRVSAQEPPWSVTERFFGDWKSYNDTWTPSSRRQDFLRAHKAELTPSLYDALLPLLVMDQTVKQGAPPIDCDPFVGGQEKFLSFQVGEQKVEQDKATVIVYTRVGRDPRPEASVVLPHRVMLILSNGHWKIDDIQGRDGSLRGMIAEIQKGN